MAAWKLHSRVFCLLLGLPGLLGTLGLQGAFGTAQEQDCMQEGVSTWFANSAPLTAAQWAAYAQPPCAVDNSGVCAQLVFAGCLCPIECLWRRGSVVMLELGEAAARDAVFGACGLADSAVHTVPLHGTSDALFVVYVMDMLARYGPALLSARGHPDRLVFGWVAWGGPMAAHQLALAVDSMNGSLTFQFLDAIVQSAASGASGASGASLTWRLQSVTLCMDN
jgi:hypothetical protein